MTRSKLLLCFLVVLFSCKATSKIKSGTYKSTCVLYDRLPRVTLVLNNDKTFTYKFPYSDDVQGTWEIANDSLVLRSKDFPSTVEPNTPIRKYTDFADKDVYLIKGKRLFALSQASGVINECYLSKE